jgi:hypothetical protein
MMNESEWRKESLGKREREGGKIEKGKTCDTSIRTAGPSWITMAIQITCAHPFNISPYKGHNREDIKDHQETQPHFLRERKAGLRHGVAKLSLGKMQEDRALSRGLGKRNVRIRSLLNIFYFFLSPRQCNTFLLWAIMSMIVKICGSVKKAWPLICRPLRISWLWYKNLA